MRLHVAAAMPVASTALAIRVRASALRDRAVLAQA